MESVAGLNFKVTIVVPTFNQGPFIKDCLDSIQGQSYRNIEVIIQDCLSTDETEVICSRVASSDTRFTYVRERDLGQSDGINRGLIRSSGQLWTWICSDDFYTNSSCIESLVSAYRSGIGGSVSCVGVFGKAVYVDESGKFIGNYFQFTRDLIRPDFRYSWPLSQPSSLLDIKKVRSVGGVKTNLHLGMDLDLFCCILHGGTSLKFVDVDVAAVRVQPNSKSVKLRLATSETALRLIRNHFGSVGDYSRSEYFQEYLRSKGLSLATYILPLPFGGLIWRFYRITASTVFRILRLILFRNNS